MISARLGTLDLKLYMHFCTLFKKCSRHRDSVTESKPDIQGPKKYSSIRIQGRTNSLKVNKMAKSCRELSRRPKLSGLKHFWGPVPCCTVFSYSTYLGGNQLKIVHPVFSVTDALSHTNLAFYMNVEIEKES